MRWHTGAVTAFVLVWFAGTFNSVQAADAIKVKFTNKTDLTVTFFLNGGNGLETRLKAGESKTYTMAVDRGIGSIVSIHQVSGKTRDFSVTNGGVYAFKMKDGEIHNFFDE